MADTNESGSWALYFRCYEQLKAINDIKDSKSWA